MDLTIQTIEAGLARVKRGDRRLGFVRRESLLAGSPWVAMTITRQRVPGLYVTRQEAAEALAEKCRQSS